MGYPVRYRSAARKYGSGGFQNPLKVPPGRRPGKPANDNWPIPDNDNHPGAGGRRNPMIPTEVPFPGASGAIEAGIKRLLPPSWRLPLEVAQTLTSLVTDPYQKPLFPDPQGTFTHGCGPSTPPIAYTGRWAFHLAGSNCGQCGLSGQALGVGSLNPPARKSGGASLSLAKNIEFSGVSRWFISDQWGGGVNPVQKFQVTWRVRPQFLPYEVPDVMPATVTNPLPAYVPVPRGNAVPNYRPMPATLPVRPEYYATDVRQSSPVGELAPGVPGVVIDPYSPLSPREPPGKRVKERKVTEQVPGTLANALGRIGGVYEGTKFAVDIVNAFYDALPGRKSAKTPQEKLMELYRRYGEVDVDKAIMNVLKAVALEKSGAYIDAARRKASKNLGLKMHIQIPTGGGPRV